MAKSSLPQKRSREDTGRLLPVMGLPAVCALFINSPEMVEMLFFDYTAKFLVRDLCMQMSFSHKPYRLIEAGEMERIAGTALHGGIVALVRSRSIKYSRA
jgi:TrmH RNA methyltransferase